MAKACLSILAEAFLVYYFTFGIAHAVTNVGRDQSALLALKAHVTNDPLNVLASNWSTNTSVCNWFGVTCSPRHRRVTALNLAYMGLLGTIPPELGNLSFLSLLNVTNNSFSGTLPIQLSNLRRLKYLSFRSNNFSSIEIPPWLDSFPKLEHLYLDGNSFIGTIPPSICNISSLLTLDLSFNQLQGHVPSSILNIPSLLAIDLSNNQFSGPMPSIYNTSPLQNIDMQCNSLSGALPENMFRFLPHLEELHLAYNQLSGQIPSTLFECKQLKILSLSVNNFIGSIPREIGNITMLKGLYLVYTNLTGEIQGLQVLALSSNRLTGVIPPEIINISSLTVLSLTANNLLGNLPSNIGHSLPNLQQLILGGNRLTGPIPSSISNASMLTLIDMPYNLFSGFIPNSLGNLRYLQWLNFGANNLTAVSSGSDELGFLTSLTNCKDLRKLILSENPLSGVVPISIGNLSNAMDVLYLSACNIKGSIPSEIGNLSNLTTLHLETNELAGSFPKAIGRLQKLQGLYLQHNKLQGSITIDLCGLRSLSEFYSDGNELNGDILNVNLSSNSLNGTLPVEIGNLKVVTKIDLSRNDLSGEIPSSIGDLKNMQHLSLADNKFQGSIPDSLGGLTSLNFLDMSSNNLSGEIPNSLKALSLLKFLNLSFNGLQGQVPHGGPFTNLSSQSFVGNKGLCGAPELKFPACKAKSNKIARKTDKNIFIYVFPIAASILLVLSLSVVLIRRQKRNTGLQIDEEMSPEVTWRRISYQELFRATDGFSENNLLGKGSFGSVYKGTLSDGMQIAVKVFNLELEGTLRSFDAECEILGSIRHRNLVKIISTGSSDHFKALVLEYMPNGSLENWMYNKNRSFDILQRLNMVIDVASALEYLHYDHPTPIIHCDLNPSNILLNESMVACLSDFGISKLLGDETSMTQTQTLATIGYMAPEYGGEWKLSRKGDVYSNGIILMETFTKKKPTDELFVGEISLKSWGNDSLHGKIINVVDINLLQKRMRISQQRNSVYHQS
ncbi:protein kinase domain-containing protein [Citrus sinensis]|uniref:Protein kinase domain-containing protein n=1 Tax=Citrus sinensis TaxID=2711 RepID=A0ACB8NGR4_CITSI|nr:protein kinase domain-containing protein [Citrus sinensis]